MGDYGIKITLAGYNALTTSTSGASNIKKFALLSTVNMLKIKAAGRVSLSNNASTTIAHGFSYRPLFWVYVNRSGILEPLYDEVDYTAAWIDGTYLRIQNKDGSTRDFYYYIFYDSQ